MATKAKKAEDPKAEEKAAKRKARMEAIKNRPAGQRPNSKQIDVIECPAGRVKTYGYPIKNKEGHQGILVTSVTEDKDGNAISTAITFVPGNLTIKAKKGHGAIVNPKVKKGKEDSDSSEEEEVETED